MPDKIFAAIVTRLDMAEAIRTGLSNVNEKAEGLGLNGRLKYAWY